MRSKQEDTPPPSPGVGEDDELYEDEIAEEIDVIEGEAEVQYFIPIILGSVTLVERILLSPPLHKALLDGDPAYKVTCLPAEPGTRGPRGPTQVLIQLIIFVVVVGRC